MSLEIAWKQNILVTDSNLLKSLLVVFGFGSQAFICEFGRQNICSVLETYWSIITSMDFQIILVHYQYSIEILKYFSVSLSVFQKKIMWSKFEYFIVLKRYHFSNCIVINFFLINCIFFCQKYQIVYFIDQNEQRFNICYLL